MKRFLSAVLAAALLVCTLPTAFAASDIDNHWAKTYITELNKIGVINPSSSGSYSPEQAIMRWEFMRYINRAFGFTEKASISFTDVASSDTYYETVQIAVKHGYINGVGNNKMDPKGTLTREQAATILGRLHKYAPTADASSLTFSDKASLSNYSKAYVAEAVKQGYINGYTDGSFKPQGLVKRGEIAKILYFFLGSSLRTSNGSYTDANLRGDTKNVTISAPGSFSNATVQGNLYITEGVLSGSVSLNNITVQGDIIVSGGDVTLDGVSAANMVVSNPLGLTPQVTCTGNTNIGHTEVQTSATLRESSLSVSAGGVSDLALTGDNLSLTLDAAVWDVSTAGVTSILTTGSTSINELTANGKTTVTGGGSVEKARLNVSGCELIMKPVSVELGGGVTAVIAGESVASSTSMSVSPSALSIDLSNQDAIAHSYDFTFNADKNDLTRVSVGGSALRLGTDYNLIPDKNGIRIYKAYLTKLKAGVYTVELLFEDGAKAVIGVTVGNAAQSAVSPSQLTFDKYDGSANYADISCTITLPTGTTLDSVKLGSTVLERGTDYNYNVTSGLVTLLRDTLAKKSKGSYTITFVPSKGSSFSCSLTVTDSAPVNEVSPSEADFDANTASGGYADLTVTLNPANNATLKNIKAGGKTLEEGWQYKLEGNKVILSKSAVAEFGKSGASYADFTFVMSSGQNPTLRVNYVTTYALTASIVDDLGLPIAGATVTFAPTDAAAGTATQTLTTDSDGKATVYVKRGSYTVTATHERFTAALTQTTTVSSSRTLKMTGEILETVQIIVNNQYGAMLSGAIVSIGGKNITTGADGTASFSLKRGNYVAQISCAGYTAQSLTLPVTGTIRERVTLK
ncbi:MAG: X2-like carbohydrate binding domain-containing protein [Eubacteriales bacterium]|nr:X2-like carbohydrate binding domain-containing protein [Eubacteriales bacterium]